MTRLAIPMLLLLALGCPPKDDTALPEGDTDTDADADADSDADSDADADADADADTDSDADADADPVITFALDGALEGTAFALTWAWPTEDGYLEGEVHHSAATDGEALWIAELEVPSEHLVELAPEHFPGLYAAMYLPTLFEDADADLAVDEGEIVVGAGLVWPLWIEGELPMEASLLGLQQGWNAIDYREADTIRFQRPEDLPLEASLWPVESILIGGVLDKAPEEALRLSVRAGHAGKDGTLEVVEGVEPLADLEVAWGEPWQVDIATPPAEDHFQAHGATGWEGALEFMRLYTDADGSGDLSDGDPLRDAICLDGEGAYLAYSQPLTSPTTAFYYAWMGMPVGWAALTGTDPETWVIMDAKQAGGLGHCEVEGAI